jgi:hypothetical protein
MQFVTVATRGALPMRARGGRRIGIFVGHWRLFCLYSGRMPRKCGLLSMYARHKALY